jgi:outer membrane autotransporter protein
LLDLSARGIWTRQDSADAIVGWEKIDFDAVDSLRTRLGGRLSFVDGSVSPYVGAYLDYEFDGKSRTRVNGSPIDAPDLKGSTGIGELGVSFKPAGIGGLSVDFGVQAYTGTREGVTGSLQVKYEF